ncbi:MAG TPA: nitroreductase family protein [Holophagaceae bacterium]|nr:nitroreductase family protein [Holophagaceae bacterium]
MDVLDAIRTRRSVRAYTASPVPRDLIERLLQAAVQAPSAMNLQPWAFAVVQDAETLRRISEAAKRAALAADPGGGRGHHGLREALESTDFSVFYDAGTLLVICATGNGPFAAGDCHLAAENLLLAAHAEGLATCPIGLALPALRQPDMKRSLGIPAGYTPVFAAILGYPRESPAPTSRHAPELVAWIQARP